MFSGIFNNSNAPFLACFLLIYALSSAVPNSAEDNYQYFINTGDHLLITVVDHERELTALTVVRPDGMVTYDIVGDIKAAGLTINQLSAAISKKLTDSGYYDKPRVTVQLREIQQEDIYVIGDVLDPGQKKSPKPISVIEALATGGGYKETADQANIRIIKKNKEPISVDLSFLGTGSGNQNSNYLLDKEFTLEDGDILLVPSAIKEKKIGIIGQVNNPGLYPVRTSITLIEALAIAGGPIDKSADMKHINVISENGSSIIDLKNTQSSPDESYMKLMRPGDYILVPEKGKLSVLGNVEIQGQFTIDSQVNIVEALSLAGVKADSNLKKLRILRATGEQLDVDASKMWRNPGQYFNEKLNPGDVLIVPAKVLNINWNSVYSALVIFTTLYAVFRQIAQ